MKRTSKSFLNVSQMVLKGKSKINFDFTYLDIKRQIHELSTTVYQIRGHIKGKTLLPFPQGAASDIAEEEKRVRNVFSFESSGCLKQFRGHTGAITTMATDR